METLSGVATCPRCGATLAPGPLRQGEGRMEECRVLVKGRGPSVCPAGCGASGLEAPDAFAALLSFARTFAESMAKRRGFFRRRWTCRTCGSELVLSDPQHRQEFAVPLPSGAGLEVTVTGPGHRCIACGRTHFIVRGGHSSFREMAGPLFGAFGEEELRGDTRS